MKVVIFPPLVGSITFLGLKDYGADLTGTYGLPSMTIGLILSLATGTKSYPFTLITGFSVGLGSTFLYRSKQFICPSGITKLGM